MQEEQAGRSKSSTFSIAVSGQIEKVAAPSFNHVYCRYTYVYGTDWTLVAGSEEGLTQVGKRAVFQAHSSHDAAFDVVWNHPLDVTFTSSNPFGWPQLVFSVMGSSSVGGDVIKGYGAIHIPPIPGCHVLSVPLFAPEASSLLGRFRAWLTGRKPELLDAKVVAQGEGRAVLTVQSEGLLFLKLNVMSRELRKHGYRLGSPTLTGT